MERSGHSSAIGTTRTRLPFSSRGPPPPGRRPSHGAWVGRGHAVLIGGGGGTIPRLDRAGSEKRVAPWPRRWPRGQRNQWCRSGVEKRHRCLGVAQTRHRWQVGGDLGDVVGAPLDLGGVGVPIEPTDRFEQKMLRPGSL